MAIRVDGDDVRKLQVGKPGLAVLNAELVNSIDIWQNKARKVMSFAIVVERNSVVGIQHHKLQLHIVLGERYPRVRLAVVLQQLNSKVLFVCLSANIASSIPPFENLRYYH